VGFETGKGGSCLENFAEALEEEVKKIISCSLYCECEDFIALNTIPSKHSTGR
jgi:hypothetical protein